MIRRHILSTLAMLTVFAIIFLFTLLWVDGEASSAPQSKSEFGNMGETLKTPMQRAKRESAQGLGV